MLMRNNSVEELDTQAQRSARRHIRVLRPQSGGRNANKFPRSTNRSLFKS
jgi:hypothetical protein